MRRLAFCIAYLIFVQSVCLLPVHAQHVFWSQNYSTATPDYTTGLVGWWRLIEGSGTTAIDSSSSANNGTWTGTAAGTSGYYSPGYVGAWAGYFNGTNDVVTIASSSVYSPTGPFTVCAWVYPKSGALTQSIFSTATGFKVSGLIIDVQNTPVLSVGYNGSGYAYQTATQAITLNNWYSFCGVYTGSYLQAYLNGVFSSEISSPLPPVAGGVGLIGNSAQGGVAHFNGLIDDVRVYNRALSPYDIAALALIHN